MLKFFGFKGYPEAQYVLVELYVEGIRFGEGMLPRAVWENLKLLNRPVVRLPDSMIEVRELGDYEKSAEVVTETPRHNGGGEEGKPEGSKVLLLSTEEKNKA